MLTGSSRFVSRVPGAPPRCDTPPGAPAPSTRITVQPVGRSVSVKCPTLIPSTSVSPFVATGAGAATGAGVCRAAMPPAAAATRHPSVASPVRYIDASLISAPGAPPPGALRAPRDGLAALPSSLRSTDLVLRLGPHARALYARGATALRPCRLFASLDGLGPAPGAARPGAIARGATALRPCRLRFARRTWSCAWGRTPGRYTRGGDGLAALPSSLRSTDLVLRLGPHARALYARGATALRPCRLRFARRTWSCAWGRTPGRYTRGARRPCGLAVFASLDGLGPAPVGLLRDSRSLEPRSRFFLPPKGGSHERRRTRTPRTAEPRTRAP